MSQFEINGLNPLPLGLFDFSNLRTSNMVYVDKTNLIYNIACQRTPTFFSRPRRFGKSLLINTLSCLFAKGIDYFKGLAIEKMWKDKTYPVVRLDFSNLAGRNATNLKEGLNNKIINQFGNNNILLNQNINYNYPADTLDVLCQKLANNSMVLLIDEYDAPLTHHIHEPNELKDITNILSDFYATVKEYTDKFRLIFITGVSRVSHVSIFSAFNNLMDLSLTKDFNSLLGFTRNELEQYFDPYIENASKILNMRKDEVYNTLEQYYDGFQFCLESHNSLYNPWSILSFLNRPNEGFVNYWFQSSGVSSLIMYYLKFSDYFHIFNYKNREIYRTKKELLGRYEITNIPADILLYQTGYYTLRQKSDELARLVFSNTEVEDSILELYLTANNLKPNIKFATEIQNLTENIDHKDLLSIINTFNAILNDCVSILSNIFDDERSVRDVIYAALPQKITLQKIKERETVKGRSDLELITKKTHMVIEFKLTKPNRDANASLQKAMNQLQSKNYGIGAFFDRILYRVAMVISNKEKKILFDFCKEVV